MSIDLDYTTMGKFTYWTDVQPRVMEHLHRAGKSQEVTANKAGCLESAVFGKLIRRKKCKSCPKHIN